MGLFNWLSKPKSNVRVSDDLIWLTRPAKFRGIAVTVQDRLAELPPPYAVLLVAFFPDCLEELKAATEQVRLDQQHVIVAAAEDLVGRSLPGMPPDPSHTIDLVAAERHPLPSHNSDLLEFAQSLPCPCRLTFHLSLEDAVFRRFAGPAIQGMLERLGMTEDQPIESRMVGRRIEQALRNIEKRALSDLRADSAEQWLERNCPNA